MQILQEIVAGVVVLLAFVVIAAFGVALVWKGRRKQSVPGLLQRHFAPTPLSRIAVTERQFPTHIRVDLNGAIDSFTKNTTICSFHGVQSDVPGLRGVDFASLLNESLVNIIGSSAV